jgi:hypothetical protein
MAPPHKRPNGALSHGVELLKRFGGATSGTAARLGARATKGAGIQTVNTKLTGQQGFHRP